MRGLEAGKNTRSGQIWAWTYNFLESNFTLKLCHVRGWPRGTHVVAEQRCEAPWSCRESFSGGASRQHLRQKTRGDTNSKRGGHCQVAHQPEEGIISRGGENTHTTPRGRVDDGEIFYSNDMSPARSTYNGFPGGFGCVALHLAFSYDRPSTKGIRTAA